MLFNGTEVYRSTCCNDSAAMFTIVTVDCNLASCYVEGCDTFMAGDHVMLEYMLAIYNGRIVFILTAGPAFKQLDSGPDSDTYKFIFARLYGIRMPTGEDSLVLVPDPAQPKIVPTRMTSEPDCAVWCLQSTKDCVGFLLIPGQNTSWIDYDLLTSAGYQGEGHKHLRSHNRGSHAYCSLILGKRLQSVDGGVTFAMAKSWGELSI
ncbi:hypothetical protein LSH36_383g02007 [Paralvinella palmiformis]|uniref:Uncharacterized protein n=1 Tax=Paralvinella palmiformis TaxID=53620 RepID=A0AAD9JCZ7_9ANNE|nr:hypothetical protein LSH36_383g02007 [Paralvinella palmiformis]